MMNKDKRKTVVHSGKLLFMFDNHLERINRLWWPTSNVKSTFGNYNFPLSHSLHLPRFLNNDTKKRIFACDDMMANHGNKSINAFFFLCYQNELTMSNSVKFKGTINYAEKIQKRYKKQIFGQKKNTHLIPTCCTCQKWRVMCSFSFFFLQKWKRRNNKNCNVSRSFSSSINIIHQLQCREVKVYDFERKVWTIIVVAGILSICIKSFNP